MIARVSRSLSGAFLNSSVGVLSILGSRSNKIPSYPRFSIDDLRNLVVPNFEDLGQAALQKLEQAYDSNALKTLLPMPQMDACPVRLALDATVSDALNLEMEMVAAIRRGITNEPSVTGKRYTGRLAS